MDARIPAPVATSRARRLEERRMMMNGRWIGAAVAAAALIASAAPAQAQMAVVDVRAVAQALQTARNTLAQLQEAQRLYQSMNSLSNMRGVAHLLDRSERRRVGNECVSTCRSRRSPSH